MDLTMVPVAEQSFHGAGRTGRGGMAYVRFEWYLQR